MGLTLRWWQVAPTRMRAKVSLPLAPDAADLADDVGDALEAAIVEAPGGWTFHECAAKAEGGLRGNGEPRTGRRLHIAVYFRPAEPSGR